MGGLVAGPGHTAGGGSIPISAASYHTAAANAGGAGHPLYQQQQQHIHQQQSIEQLAAAAASDTQSSHMTTTVPGSVAAFYNPQNESDTSSSTFHIPPPPPPSHLYNHPQQPAAHSPSNNPPPLLSLTPTTSISNNNPVSLSSMTVMTNPSSISSSPSVTVVASSTSAPPLPPSHYQSTSSCKVSVEISGIPPHLPISESGRLLKSLVDAGAHIEYLPISSKSSSSDMSGSKDETSGPLSLSSEVGGTVGEGQSTGHVTTTAKDYRIVAVFPDEAIARNAMNLCEVGQVNHFKLKLISQQQNVNNIPPSFLPNHPVSNLADDTSTFESSACGGFFPDGSSVPSAEAAASTSSTPTASHSAFASLSGDCAAQTGGPSTSTSTC